MKNQVRQKNTGFTLIELLIAMSIGTLIAMAFFMIVNISIKNNTKNEQDIKLLNIATSEMESIREQIKDTINDSIVVNTTNKDKQNKIYLQFNEQGNVSLVYGEDPNKYQLNGNILVYKNEQENIKYNATLDISRESTQNTYLYIYNIDLKLKLEDATFSKKEIHLQTKVFGK